MIRRLKMLWKSLGKWKLKGDCRCIAHGEANYSFLTQGRQEFQRLSLSQCLLIPSHLANVSILSRADIDITTIFGSREHGTEQKAIAQLAGVDFPDIFVGEPFQEQESPQVGPGEISAGNQLLVTPIRSGTC